MESKKQAIVMMGIPGAGKSFQVERIQRAAEGERFTVLNPDTIGERLFGEDFLDNPSKYHIQIKPFFDTEKTEAIERGENIILDTTAITLDATLRTLVHLDKMGYEIQLVYVKVSLKTAIERNKDRRRVLKEEIIVNKFQMVEGAFSTLKALVHQYMVINND